HSRNRGQVHRRVEIHHLHLNATSTRVRQINTFKNINYSKHTITTKRKNPR
ncbi:hypothetical protein IscW_ISCW021085, partial [Ixodes scapularis]